MRTTRRNGKVIEALGLLTEAAKEKKDRFRDLVNEKALSFKESLADQADQGLEMLQGAKKRLLRALRDEEELIRKKAREIDKKIHLNPWPVVGVAAFSAFVIGFIVRKKIQKPKLEKSAQTLDSKEEKEQDVPPGE